MNDILPDEAKLWRRLEDAARELFKNYGFGEIRTPILEETALFARGVGDATQIVQKEMYTFLDRGNDSVTLRPEGTAGVVRAAIQNSLLVPDEITKVYYSGAMFRYERPQKGRLRQFHQIGCEVFGTDSAIADAEVVILVDRLAKKLSVGEFTLQVNSLGTKEERTPYLKNLILFLKNHASELCAECQVRVEKNPLRTFDCKSEKCQIILRNAPTIFESLQDDSRRHFDLFQEELARANVSFVLNPRIVRGLDYYEKTAFEFVSNNLGAQSTFCGGGRYNHLVEELGGRATPGVGFGLGCERVILLMQNQELKNTSLALSGVFVVALNPEAFGLVRQLVCEARDQGVRAESVLELRSLKSQMRKADKGEYAFAVLIGEDEMKSKNLTVKNLATSEQSQIQLENWTEFLHGVAF